MLGIGGQGSGEAQFVALREALPDDRPPADPLPAQPVPVQPTPPGEPAAATGQAFALFVYAVAAAEAAVGLALIIAIWRSRSTVVLEEVDLLKG